MKKKVLFLCEGNSCHSQMAEGLLRHFYGNEYDVFSAGINPIEVDKNTVEVMNEIGIDISKQASKHINKFLNQNFDVIITFRNEAQKPYPTFFTEVERLNWSFYDPAESLEYQPELPKALRELRDDIKRKITEHFKPH